MIGTGVFTSLFFQVGAIHSGFSLLMLWVFGGIAALCGSLVYSELATLYPRSGGEYNLLTQIYHPAVGFISGWISITVGFAAPVAVNAMILGEYVHGVNPEMNPLKIAIVVVIVVSIIHSISVKFGSQFQNIFTILKLVLIVILILGGMLLGNKQHFNFIPSKTAVHEMLSMPYAISLVFISYAFSGWNAAAYFASEIKNPNRNIPRAMIFGTLVVMFLYVLLNYTFLQNIPFSDIGLAENADTGLVAAIHIFGVSLGKTYGIFFSIALVASISSMIFAGPRVTQVMGEDYAFFKFAAIQNKSGAPYVATLVQMTISLLLMLTSSYGDIFAYIGFTLSLITLMTVLGIFIVRFKNKSTTNYKSFGYPIVPLIFIGLSIWMIYFTVVGNTKVSLIGFGTAISGLVFYYFSPRKINNSRPPFESEKESPLDIDLTNIHSINKKI